MLEKQRIAMAHQIKEKISTTTDRTKLFNNLLSNPHMYMFCKSKADRLQVATIAGFTKQEIALWDRAVVRHEQVKLDLLSKLAR